MKKRNYKGIKKASGETVNWSPRSGGYTEVFYDMDADEVWTVDQISIGQNSWTEYHDPAIIKICNTTCHMTMKQIKEAIESAIQMQSLK